MLHFESKGPEIAEKKEANLYTSSKKWDQSQSDSI
jgi:hypothetical protein